MKEDRDIACRRCGSCCHLDMIAYVTLEDVRRWQTEGRHDIIARLRDNDVTWSDDRLVNKFGANIKTCRMTCVYLKWDGASASCGIYEARTTVCRSYIPGSSGLCPLYYREKQVPHYGR